MPERLTLKAFLEQQGRVPGVYPAPSGTPMNLVLRVLGPVDDPITVIRMLSKRIPGLKKAHDAFSRALMGETVPILLVIDDLPAFQAEMAALHVEVTAPSVPDSIDVQALRSRLGLTQAELAMRFGLDIDAIQNWEQGRTTPDRTARILLKVIETRPEAVDAALS